MDLFRRYDLGDGALFIGRLGLDRREVEVRYKVDYVEANALGEGSPDSLNVVWCCK